MHITDVAQLIKKGLMCLPLSSAVASWLHSQGALKLSLQVDDAAAHCQWGGSSMKKKDRIIDRGTRGHLRVRAERDFKRH